MRARIAATVVLAAGILVGTAGCGLFAPQATTIHYDASDGVSGSVGEVDVRNALLITNDGSSANLIVSLVNPGNTSRTMRVQYDSENGKVTDEITVSANDTVTLGDKGAPTVTLRDVKAEPGALFPVFFQYGNETGTQLLVPVLDGALDQYSTLTPTPVPTATPGATDTPLPTLIPTPTPTPTP